MQKFMNVALLSLCAWIVWVGATFSGAGPKLDGVALMFSALTTAQLVAMAGMRRSVDAFKTLLVLQTVVNLGYLAAVALGANLDAARDVLMLACTSCVAIAFAIVFRLRGQRGATSKA